MGFVTSERQNHTWQTGRVRSTAGCGGSPPFAVDFVHSIHLVLVVLLHLVLVILLHSVLVNLPYRRAPRNTCPRLIEILKIVQRVAYFDIQAMCSRHIITALQIPLVLEFIIIHNLLRPTGPYCVVSRK
jgi:hypothetical protein